MLRQNNPDRPHMDRKSKVYMACSYAHMFVTCLIAFVIERFHNAVEIDILGIFEEYSSLQIWPPQKIFQGRNYSGRARALFLTGVEFHFLPSMRLGVLQVCASLSSLTFSSRLVCFLWTVLPCLFMFTNTIAYAFRCQPRKQLYLIAFVDLVPVAKEKVSLIRWNTVWNRWKRTLSARSIRVNLNHGKEM